jgi:UDP-N-acetylmuramoyl-tripeptide--D-alanyl-D-alanine ligase
LWSTDAFVAAAGGRLQGQPPPVLTGVAIDSRTIAPGEAFVAIRGERFDGHEYAAAALEKGAALAVVTEGRAPPRAGPLLLVPDDPLDALRRIGVAARERMRGGVIAVTGSVGKTGTKEALYAALDRAARGKAHRSVKSYNNHTGVPLSLARMPREARFGVFEMGMNHAGELAALTRLVRPHIAIVTAIAPAHREFFSSEEEIADAKGEIFQGLEPGGTALVPFDSPHRDRLIAAAKPHAATILTFGAGEGADIRAVDAMPSPKGGTLVTAVLPDAELTFTISQPGEHWVSNSMAVLGAVQALGGDLAAAGLALADMAGLKGRGERHWLPVGGGEALLIDESYNANPASMRATLKTLRAHEVEGRRIAVLGSMRELGVGSEAFHAELAEPVEAACVDYAILVGQEMAALAKALGPKVNRVHVPDVASAIDLARSEIRPGDAILVKGSNSIGLAALVEALASGPWTPLGTGKS